MPEGDRSLLWRRLDPGREEIRQAALERDEAVAGQAGQQDTGELLVIEPISDSASPSGGPPGINRLSPNVAVVAPPSAMMPTARPSGRGRAAQSAIVSRRRFSRAGTPRSVHNEEPSGRRPIGGRTSINPVRPIASQQTSIHLACRRARRAPRSRPDAREDEEAARALGPRTRRRAPRTHHSANIAGMTNGGRSRISRIRMAGGHPSAPEDDAGYLRRAPSRDLALALRG